MTSKQDNDKNQRFRNNLQRELSALERKKAWKVENAVGMRAVTYFGTFVGGLIAFMGLMWVLNAMNILRLSLNAWIGIAVVALGILVILGSIFAAKAMPSGEYYENWYGYGPTVFDKNVDQTDVKSTKEDEKDDGRHD